MAGLDWGDVRLRLPDLTFPEQITLHQGGHEIQLIHVGPAHTTNDIVAWLPGPRVLFAGDVVMNWRRALHPHGVRAGLPRRDRAVARSVRGGDRARSRPGRRLELLDANARYLRWIQRLTAAGRAAGLTLSPWRAPPTSASSPT
ncbi:hypothetical protein LT493_02230 [Streptomyces tricolor]|nr:hypothetical protein [Streptomyces tricolor]